MILLFSLSVLFTFFFFQVPAAYFKINHITSKLAWNFTDFEVNIIMPLMLKRYLYSIRTYVILVVPLLILTLKFWGKYNSTFDANTKFVLNTQVDLILIVPSIVCNNLLLLFIGQLQSPVTSGCFYKEFICDLAVKTYNLISTYFCYFLIFLYPVMLCGFRIINYWIFN